MAGAALFTLVLIAVLVAGTYLLQIAYAAMVIAYHVGGIFFCAVWAVLEVRLPRTLAAQRGGARADDPSASQANLNLASSSPMREATHVQRRAILGAWGSKA